MCTLFLYGFIMLVSVLVLTFQHKILWVIVQEPLVVATISLCNQHGRHRDENQAQYLPMLYSAATKLMLTKMCRIFAGECPLYFLCCLQHFLTYFLVFNRQLEPCQWQIRMRCILVFVNNRYCYRYLYCNFFFTMSHSQQRAIIRFLQLAICYRLVVEKIIFHKARDISKQMSIIMNE